MSENKIIANSGILEQALHIFNKKVEVAQQMQEIKVAVNNAVEQKVLQVMNTNIIPQELRGKKQELAEIATMAEHRGVPFLTLLNNIQFIDGRMGWKSTYVIACINKASNRFSAPLNFRSVGNIADKTYGKKAYTYDLNNNLIEGPVITIDIAERAGWTNKEKSMWNTLPELMLSYRAATLFGRLFSPDILDGMLTIDELVDIYSVSGNLPKDAIEQKLIEVLNESQQVVIEEVKTEVVSIVKDEMPKIKTKSILEAMFEDLENNGWLATSPTFHKDSFFVKVEQESQNADMLVLSRWDFGQTKNGSFVKNVTSIMTQEEKNEHK